MSLTSEQLSVVSEVVGTAASLRDAAAYWRAHYPQVHAVLVEASEMRGETPALVLGARQVFLATSEGHCWRLTDRPEEASLLIFTQEGGAHGD
jgi:hypothetical protein